jgi:hypothetical protein
MRSTAIFALVLGLGLAACDSNEGSDTGAANQTPPAAAEPATPPAGGTTPAQ